MAEIIPALLFVAIVLGLAIGASALVVLGYVLVRILLEFLML
jgi:hypothetical protein